MKEININIEGYNVNGICVSCLNYNRTMFYHEDVRECFRILANIDVPDGLTVQVCWECLARVKAALSFRAQILEAYDCLIKYSRTHTFLDSPTDLSSEAYTRLSVYKNENIDIKPSHHLKDEEPLDAKDIKVEADDKLEIDQPQPFNGETQLDNNLEQKLKMEFYENFDFQSRSPSVINDSVSSDDDVILSNLKTSKKKEKKGRRERKSRSDNKKSKEETTEEHSRKPRRLPEDVQVYTMTEEDMWAVRARDRGSEEFTAMKHTCSDCLLYFQTKKQMDYHMAGKHEQKMDVQKLIDDRLKRKRQMTNERVKKYRKLKRAESQQLKSSIQDDPNEQMKEQQAKEYAAERKRAKAKERSRRLRERKRLNVLRSVHEADVHDSQILKPSHGNPPLVIGNQRSTINISQIAGASNNDSLVMRENQGTMIHDSQIAGTSKNMNVPLVVRDDSGSLNRIGEKVLSVKEEGEPAHDNLAALEDQVCASPTINVHYNKSSATYSAFARHSSAHVQFYKQFTQNEFGYACKVCDRLWFKLDLKSLTDDSVEFVRTFLPNVDKNSIAVCFTCRISIRKKCIPKMAVYNGFEYPKIPDNLRNSPLDLVSERLISPRIPFMQIRRLRHVSGQCGIYGQVINVPMEVNTLVNKLPRNVNDDHCIDVNIKRKKIHESSFSRGLINKRTVKKWLKYLVNTPLYVTHNITVDEQFFGKKHDEELPLGGSNENEENSDLEDIPIEESLIAQQQTVMWNDDLYLKITPKENNLPITLLYEHAEELSFPSIYLGQFRQFRDRVIVTPFMMASSELRRSDRRGVTPQHLLYVAMKIMRMRVKDSLNIAFKHIGKRCNITKQEIQSKDYIHNSIESNLGFLRYIPNSTWHWSERKKDLFAMIRQLGKPTVFFTVSANEIEWLDLLQLLYKLKKHVHITKQEISQLHYMVKSTLINEDAVTCVIYFNKLVNVIINILQSKLCSPFGKYRVCHYFKRIEFQRGSPHAHILAWLDNAPEDALNKDYDKAIELIDTLISVSAAEASGNIKLQTHKHTYTCYKSIIEKKTQKCRFEAPFMPCKETIILTPMKNTEEGFINYQKRYAQIRVRLENEDFEDMDSFYNRNGINSDEDYYNIIRAGITRPKVFVKREPSEKWHNPFNPFILNIAQSYTDFQFITEESSCAAYAVDYVNRTNRGVSDLQRKIIETMNEHPEFDIIGITKNISVNILNNTEITSQEAAWYLLREPMSKASVNIVYIPTVRPIERQRIKNTMNKFSELVHDFTDVSKENWFDKYEKRPKHLESITLAQFVSKYTQDKERKYIERHEPQIIRYRNYDMNIDFNEYKREMVTLHLPFRNEEQEILAEIKFIKTYDDNEDIILQRRKEFESDIDIDKTIQICRELCREETPVDGDEIQKTSGTSQCDVCTAYFAEENITVHRSQHLNGLRCLKCDFTTTMKRLMNLHLHKAHDLGSLYPCKECGSEFSTKSKLNYHKIQCSTERPQCDCCGKVFANKITLRQHLKPVTVTSKQQKPVSFFPCKGCDKVFFSRKSYKAHVVVHDGLSYACPTCGKLFRWKRNLSRHARNHRERAAGAVHHCRECGKSFSSRDCLNNHLRLSKRHVGESAYIHTCNYCGKKFATKWCMVDHIDWEHLKRIKYQCSVCFKAFKTAKIMVAHMQNIHDGKNKKPDSVHLCDICGKSYKTAKRLKGHVWAMHTMRSQSKTFKCNLCPATFAWKTSIYKHMKMMHDSNRRKTQRAPTKKLEPYPEIEVVNRVYFQTSNLVPMPQPPLTAVQNL